MPANPIKSKIKEKLEQDKVGNYAFTYLIKKGRTLQVAETKRDYYLPNWIL